MRRLLPLALILVACAKPEEAPAPVVVKAPPKATPLEKAPDTPEAMAKAMDVPLYPGAEAPDRMSSAPEKRTDGGIGYSLVLATKDPVPAVAAWYGKQLKLPALPGKKGMTVVGLTGKGNQTIVNVAPEAGRTFIRIKSIVYAH